MVPMLFMLQGVFVLGWIWFWLNPYQMDHLGHLASGVSSFRGLYHKHQDAFFMGGIHGLFYPPLEDLLLTFWLWITRAPETAYRLHLSAIVIGTVGAWALLLTAFKKIYARIGLALVLTALLWAGKHELLDFQGLSWVDLMTTGLTSQMLGGIFLALLLHESITLRRPAQAALFVAFCVLAHLVVGMVAGAITLCLLFLPSNERRYPTGAYAAALLAMLGATAFFWLPFVWHRAELVPSMILRAEPLVFLIVSGAVAVLAWEFPLLRNFSVLAILLLGVNTAVNALQSHGLSVPTFHYYRFSMFGLLIGSLVLFLLLEKLKTPRKFARLALGLLVLQWAYGIWKTFEPHKPTLTPSPVVDFSKIRPEAEGRTWILGPGRSIDFSLDSRLWVEHPEMRFVKGLFWESASANTWLNSYFATLLSPPVVLDYFYFYNYPCDIQRCLLDHFVAQAGITSWIVPEDFALPYLSPAQSSCYRQITASGGTSRFKLERTGSLKFGEKTLTQFALKPRAPAEVGSTWIERISPSQLEALPDSVRPQESALRRIYESCQKGQVNSTAWLQARDLPEARARVASLPPKGVPQSGSIQKSAPGKYEIDLPGPPGHFRIKLSPLPGVALLSEQGETLPLWKGYPHLIGHGSGKMTLEFKELREVRWGNAVSLVSTLLIALGMAFVRQKPLE